MEQRIAHGTREVHPESLIGQLYGDDFREGVRLYHEKHQQIVALTYFIRVLKEFNDVPNAIPIAWLRDVEYYTYKAWIMSSNDPSRILELPMKLPTLEQHVAISEDPIQRRAVWMVAHFGRTGLLIHDALERRKTKKHMGRR